MTLSRESTEQLEITSEYIMGCMLNSAILSEIPEDLDITMMVESTLGLLSEMRTNKREDRALFALDMERMFTQSDARCYEYSESEATRACWNEITAKELISNYADTPFAKYYDTQDQYISGPIDSLLRLNFGGLVVLRSSALRRSIYITDKGTRVCGILHDLPTIKISDDGRESFYDNIAGDIVLIWNLQSNELKLEKVFCQNTALVSALKKTIDIRLISSEGAERNRIMRALSSNTPQTEEVDVCDLFTTLQDQGYLIYEYSNVIVRLFDIPGICQSPQSLDTYPQYLTLISFNYENPATLKYAIQLMEPTDNLVVIVYTTLGEVEIPDDNQREIYSIIEEDLPGFRENGIILSVDLESTESIAMFKEIMKQQRRLSDIKRPSAWSPSFSFSEDSQSEDVNKQLSFTDL
ncbi:MAG: hypothetical protein JXR42_02640 [Gammaproteobacteria bacterium]|nr:hypothetical protein [Gammaproteobacteria bacterium]